MSGRELGRAYVCDSNPGVSNIVNDTVLSIVITSKDVHGLAEANDIDFDEALQRVRDWARHLEDAAEGLLMEQLKSVIVRGQP